MVAGPSGWRTRSGLHLAPSLGTFTSVDAASFGAGLSRGWLNAVTADLTVTQVAQGQGLVGTSAIPGLLTGPRKNTRFFFILRSEERRGGSRCIYAFAHS